MSQDIVEGAAPRSVAKVSRSASTTRMPMATTSFICRKSTSIRCSATSSDTGRFDFLMHVTAVDYPNRAKRFDVVYELFSSRTVESRALKNASGRRRIDSDGDSGVEGRRLVRARNLRHVRRHLRRTSQYAPTVGASPVCRLAFAQRLSGGQTTALHRSAAGSLRQRSAFRRSRLEIWCRSISAPPIRPRTELCG